MRTLFWLVAIDLLSFLPPIGGAAYTFDRTASPVVSSFPTPTTAIMPPATRKALTTSRILLSGQAVTIDELYHEIKKIQETMVRREDLGALLDTIEILSNPETMAAIQKSEEDIAAGRYREISSIDDLLGELS